MRYPALLESNADARGCEYVCFGSRHWRALKNLGRICRVSKMILPRKLWYADVREHICVDQSFLQDDQRSLVVLGEAGMGKSTLLAQLADVEGYAFCTARKLINSPDPAHILGDAKTLVIDALDEVSAQRDGDAVDLVMRRLGVLSNPRFILSCRVADWRSATALQGIADLYDRAPLELHLEPLDRADAIAFLAETLGDARAEAAINHLEARGLSGLWANPQTLELVEKVASEDRLPSSKGNLFTEATNLLRAEHREEKAGTTLAGMGEAEVLDAAGAAFATLILTGKDALSRRVNDDGDDLPVREISSLPGASDVEDILDSRLFVARGTERFAYAHRAIGEFLGARWLARNADTPRKRHRLLELFSNHALVPASLRGIHSWLAWHSSELAAPVIAADPMGVVEYGDADRLTPEQGRALFRALQSVSRDNPRFRDWSEYRVGGLIQPALLPEIREILTDPEVEFGLRLLVLQALKGSPLVQDLADILLALLLNPMAIFANRREAGNRLADLEASVDWPDIIAQLRAQDDEDGVRLASELMDEIGYDRPSAPSASIWHWSANFQSNGLSRCLTALPRRLSAWATVTNAAATPRLPISLTGCSRGVSSMATWLPSSCGAGCSRSTAKWAFGAKRERLWPKFLSATKRCAEQSSGTSCSSSPVTKRCGNDPGGSPNVPPALHRTKTM
jgi:hypothetical protein